MDFIGMQDLMKYVETGDEPSKAKKSTRRVGGSDVAEEEAGITHLFFGNGAKFDITHEEEYIDYIGNESSPGMFVYVSAVLSLGPRKL